MGRRRSGRPLPDDLRRRAAPRRRPRRRRVGPQAPGAPAPVRAGPAGCPRRSPGSARRPALAVAGTGRADARRPRRRVPERRVTPAVDSWVDNARRAAVITTSFDHPAEVVWTLFADPDKLARWWGPPGAPMTIERHDLRPGGAVELTVTTGGTRIRGRWDIHEVAAPHGLG